LPELKEGCNGKAFLIHAVIKHLALFPAWLMRHDHAADLLNFSKPGLQTHDKKALNLPPLNRAHRHRFESGLFGNQP
jgi:hypothetical protein